MGCGSSRDDHQEATFERSEPLLDFDCKSFEHGGVQVAQVAVQGWRKTMEDVALVQFGVSPREDTLALGVFDGHSGAEAAQFAKEKLLGHIQETDEWARGDVGKGCIHGFMEADVAMRKAGVQSGTTAVLALVGPDEIVVANCGDSRSVLSRGGRQLPMSVDHKPGRKAESRRVLRSGGYLDETDPRNPRVVCDSLNMSIATSRALGDFDFKSNPSRQPEEQMISPVPELYTRRRVPQDEFLILATDGVWDVMDNPGIVSFLQMEAAALDHLREETNGGEEEEEEEGRGGGADKQASAELLARAVLQRCLDLGSRDNMTIVLADLRQRQQRQRRKVRPRQPSPPEPEPEPEPEAGAPSSSSGLASGGTGGGGGGGGRGNDEDLEKVSGGRAATAATAAQPAEPAVATEPAADGEGVDPAGPLNRDGSEIRGGGSGGNREEGAAAASASAASAGASGSVETSKEEPAGGGAPAPAPAVGPPMPVPTRVVGAEAAAGTAVDGVVVEAGGVDEDVGVGVSGVGDLHRSSTTSAVEPLEPADVGGGGSVGGVGEALLKEERSGLLRLPIDGDEGVVGAAA